MEIEERIRAGDVRAASRLIRDIEDSIPNAKSSIKNIFQHTGKAHVLGVTGSPGAGKSTLVGGLIEAYRKIGKTIGVLAVDPTSPFTGGATLGDRIRMQQHAEDPGVFIRSLATRGALGGLSKAVGDAIHVMDAMGKDVILVETVGTGQQEVEIINHAHTVVVVLVPGMGDEIQAIKAGIMEIADIFVINKSDREGAAKLQRELMIMLDMSPLGGESWRPPIINVGNAFKPEIFGRDIENLRESIEGHFEYLIKTNLMNERLRRRNQHELQEALRSSILDPVLECLASSGELERMIEKLLRKETDPCTLSEEVARRYLQVY